MGSFCSECGHEIPAIVVNNEQTQQYCSSCGASSATPICSNCRSNQRTAQGVPSQPLVQSRNTPIRDAKLAIIGAVFLPACLSLYMLINLVSATSISDGAGILFAFLVTFGLGVVPPIVTLASHSWKARRLSFAGPFFWSLLIAGAELNGGDYGTPIATILMLGVPPLILMWLRPVQRYVDDYSSTWFLLFTDRRTADDLLINTFD